MISSPCKTCHRRHLPKKECINQCAKLRNLQNLQHTMTIPPHSTTGADTGSFRLAVPSSRGRAK